nr:hypothetical protein CPGR_00310 [Mycolicibacterium malmesburyense]
MVYGAVVIGGTATAVSGADGAVDLVDVSPVVNSGAATMGARVAELLSA